MSQAKPTLDDLIEFAKQGIESAIRRVHEKHGDVHLSIERGTRQWPDEQSGRMHTEHTGLTMITIDAPSGRRIGNVCGHPGGESPVEPGALLDALAPGEPRTSEPLSRDDWREVDAGIVETAAELLDQERCPRCRQPWPLGQPHSCPGRWMPLEGLRQDLEE